MLKGTRDLRRHLTRVRIAQLTNFDGASPSYCATKQFKFDS
jgi:hypothetical protein